MRDNRPFVDDYRPSRYQSMFGEQRGGQYRAVCSDGRVRTATATGEADTWFSIPARVNVNGRTVTGYISAVDWYDLRVAENDVPPARYEFRQYTYRKNADALPDWTVRS